jgi:hypothetical protein
MIRLLIDLDADFMLFYLCMLATLGIVVKIYQVFIKEKKVNR